MKLAHNLTSQLKKCFSFWGSPPDPLHVYKQSAQVHGVQLQWVQLEEYGSEQMLRSNKMEERCVCKPNMWLIWIIPKPSDNKGKK